MVQLKTDPQTTAVQITHEQIKERPISKDIMKQKRNGRSPWWSWPSAWRRSEPKAETARPFALPELAGQSLPVIHKELGNNESYFCSCFVYAVPCSCFKDITFR